MDHYIQFPSDVSIVSIQTDQSRHDAANFVGIKYVRFQSYQSKQINPDSSGGINMFNFLKTVSIVSIQTDQSRRDCDNGNAQLWGAEVSIVSIQTDQSRRVIFSVSTVG